MPALNITLSPSPQCSPATIIQEGFSSLLLKNLPQGMFTEGSVKLSSHYGTEEVLALQAATHGWHSHYFRRLRWCTELRFNFSF